MAVDHVDALTENSRRHAARKLAIPIGMMLGFLCLAGSLSAADAKPPGDNVPVLKLDAGGPLSFVSSLAFSPDGRTLYAAGWDKVVHVWRENPESGSFEYDRNAALRVPVGPGVLGGINSITLSADGEWLAVAGRGMARGLVGFREPGLVLPPAAMSDEMRLDMGMIYVFNTRTRKTRLLRGHAGSVLAMKFARTTGGKIPSLVSAAEELTGQQAIGIVRVWNLSDGKELAKLDRVPVPVVDVPASQWKWRSLPGGLGLTPDLSIWRTGFGSKDLRVAIAWGDNFKSRNVKRGRFRVWEVNSGRVTTQQTEQFSLTVSHLGGRAQRLLAGGFGRLTSWNVISNAGGGLTRATAASTLDLGPRRMPLSLSLYPSRVNGPSDRAACVVEDFTNSGGTYRLRLIDVGRMQLIGDEIDLWSGARKTPSVAASPDGRLLAVAGNGANTVELFAVADLQARKNEPRQTLRGGGVSMQSVRFVRKGESLGLSLKATAAPGAASRKLADTILFDISAGSASSDSSGWQSVSPDLQDWTVRQGTETKKMFVGKVEKEVVVANLRVSKDGRLIRTFTLEVREALTAHALCPTTKHTPVPILAVATHFGGEPLLRLFDAQSGNRVREFTGHTERIRSIAFSDDGRLLASAAEDRTVSAWWLPDLQETIGKKGHLSGLVVEDGNNGVRVIGVAQGSAAAKSGMRTGDVVTGASTPAVPNSRGAVIPFSSAFDFYLHVATRVPEAKIVLATRRGGANRQVTLTVDQATDERKPLFSLFFTPDEAAKRWSWIGWHPIGKYDASDPAVEQKLGWHFNTGDAAAPTRFATADQYRQQNRSKGLLKTLIDTGRPPQESDTARLKPTISLVVAAKEGEALKPDYDDQLFVQTKDVSALVVVEDFPADKVKSLEWQLGDGKFQPLQQSAEGDWQSDLSQADWTRGAHKLRVRLRTAEYPEREFFAVETVRYQPSGPTIKSAVKEAFSQVDKPEFSMTANLGNIAEPTVVTLTHRFDGKVIDSQTLTIDKDFDFNRQLTLSPGPGVNEIKIVARNKNALSGYEFFETATLTKRIRFDKPVPKTLELPEIALRTVTQQPAGGQPLTVEPGKWIVVDVPKVRVAGEITAKAALTKAEFVLGDRSTGLKEFQPGGLTFTFAEDVVLQPGRQTIRFAAKTADGGDEQRLLLDYRPPLPGLRIASPQAKRNVFYAGRDSESLKLEAELTDANRQPYQAIVLKNGTEFPDAVLAVDAAKGLLTATVPLKPGENRIQIRLSNKWNVEETSESIYVNYLRPPKLVDVKLTLDPKLPFVDVVGTIQSPRDLQPTGVEIKVNGELLPSDSLQQRIELVQNDPTGTRWSFSLAEIPLDAGENEIALAISNAEGRSLARVLKAKPAAPAEKPTIQFLNPLSSDNTASIPQFTVQFRIKSASPLKKTALILNGRRTELNSKDAKKDAEGYDLFEREIALDTGSNIIQVECTNEGGRLVESRRINRLRLPATVAVDKVVATNFPTQVLKPVYLAGGVSFRDSIPDGHATIHGHVSWAGKAVEHQQFVRIWVNGFLQIAPLSRTPDASGNSPFQTNVVLSQKKNHIEVELPADIPVDSGNRLLDNNGRLRLQLDTLEPELRQQLHLLIVGVKMRDGKNVADGPVLEKQARQALHLRAGNSAFEKVKTYGPLVGRNARSGVVRAQMMLMKSRIKSRVARDQPNDVIVIYYQGREVVDKRGEFVLADRRNWGNPALDESALSSGYLSRFLNRTPGAHLLFLDVEQIGPVGGKTANRWPRTPHLGMLRVAWSKSNQDLPESLTLIGALSTTVSAAETIGSAEVRLRSLEDRIRKNMSESGRNHPSAPIFDPQVPAELAELIVGKFADQ